MFQTKIRELKRQRRRRLQTGHLKREFALLQTLSHTFNLVQFEKQWQFFFWSWTLKDCIEVQEKKGKLLSCVHVSTKRKNRKFRVVVMQRRQRTVQKCVMHVQSYRFANPNLLLFCRSCCRHRCSRLSSLILWIKLRYTRGSFQYVANCSLKTNLATPSRQSKTIQEKLQRWSRRNIKFCLTTYIR